MGISSNPHTRTISSTRSASPMISARHGGTAHSIRSPLPETSKPKDEVSYVKDPIVLFLNQNKFQLAHRKV